MCIHCLFVRHTRLDGGETVAAAIDCEAEAAHKFHRIAGFLSDLMVAVHPYWLRLRQQHLVDCFFDRTRSRQFFKILAALIGIAPAVRLDSNIVLDR